MAKVSSLRAVPLKELVESQETRRQLCGGQLLLRIRLAPDEVASLYEPDPLFSLVPRVAYLPFLFHDVLEHFKKSISRMGQPYELWFDYNNIALKWHFPVGVLCDSVVGMEVPVPWDLTVHFRGNSSLTKDLLPFSGMADLQRSVMNAFKQAIFLEIGSAARFMRLEKKEHMTLWNAILKSDLDTFSQVKEKLMCTNLVECKSVAVRLHLWSADSTHGSNCDVLLHRAPPLDEDGTANTVQDFLNLAMPPLLKDGQLAEGVEILLQGLQVPLDTPLYWLSLHASYLDHFVHLVARMPDTSFGDTVNQ
ncbi:unnamed protein product [Cladocopium goreaui]|uniref:Autophagy protein 5 n=1 Tax=Cladocopium goreaui TaxID=2562237 RepID=A0A9P1FR08_9DINO|nr:unnamed protein product [Cladocopium goreaui]|mmetsp:Transcript_54475/g.119241  ORF Transcript_54475/g.119241 Transcript_54475/m.119241 type:complete len:307 (+) Transcript_54475:28-948(+)